MSKSNTKTHHDNNRGHIGANIRLYGFPGVYEIVSRHRLWDWIVCPIKNPRCTFSTMDSSIVEIDGHRVPLQSLPIVPPSDDYPYAQTLLDIRCDDRETPLGKYYETHRQYRYV